MVNIVNKIYKIIDIKNIVNLVLLIRFINEHEFKFKDLKKLFSKTSIKIRIFLKCTILKLKKFLIHLIYKFTAK